MGKLIAIGDIHGNRSWEDIISANKDFSKVVFIGDYFDSINIPADEQIRNFQEIIKFKEANQDKVILLIGNHCIHYILSYFGERYSGFQHKRSFEITHLIKSALPLMQMCHIDGNNLFSHAGITNTWLQTYDYKPEKDNVESFVNDLFKYQPLSFKFQGIDPYGDDVEQSPVWVRPRSLLRDKLAGFIHVVGHTSARRLDIDDVEKRGIILIDTLAEKQYLVINDGNYEVKTF